MFKDIEENLMLMLKKLSSARRIQFNYLQLILKGHEQSYYKKLFFSMDSIEFKVQLAPFVINAIIKRKWSPRLCIN